MDLVFSGLISNLQLLLSCNMPMTCLSILPCCWVCSSRMLLAVLISLLLATLSEILVDNLFAVVQILHLCAPLPTIWPCLFRLLLLITGSSGCDAVFVLCLLVSITPALLFDSLLLRSLLIVSCVVELDV